MTSPSDEKENALEDQQQEEREEDRIYTYAHY